MTAILRMESKRFTRSSVILTGVFALTTAFFLAVFPALKEEAQLVRDVYPEYMIRLLGFEELHTIEGFAAGYIYPFVWIVFGGVYFAYLGGGLIAGDIQSRKMDLTLSNPVSRESVLAQKVAALWVPLVVSNVGVAGTIYLGSIVVGESFDVSGLVLVHLLSIPYLLVCAGIGVVLSVVIDRAGTAQVTAIVVVFMLWLMDGVSQMEPDYEWIGDATPSRYFDPNDVLVAEEFSFLDASILLVGFLALLALATVVFTRRDI